MGNRAEKIIKNIRTGIFYRIIQIVFNFIIRAMFINYLNETYLGLNSLLTSLLQMLNVAEMGIGNAIVYSMYRPVVENNQEKLNALLNLYKKYYRIVGCIVLVVGIALMPFLNILIKEDVPIGINVQVAYSIFLLYTVIGYFLFSYRTCIFIANQKEYIYSRMITCVYLISYIIQIRMIAIKNYYGYLIAMLVTIVVINIILFYLSRKYYPRFYCKGKVLKDEVSEINQKIKGLLFYKIGASIYNNADSIIISSFLGLSILGIYSNYLTIILALNALIGTIANSLTPSIGNALVVENEEYSVTLFKNMNNVSQWIIGWMAVCLFNLVQPFMIFWMGESNLLSMTTVFLLSLYFFFMNNNVIIGVFKSASGIWWEDRYRQLIGGLTNLFLNLWWVNIIKLNGVILSSVVSSVVIFTPWALIALKKKITSIDYIRIIKDMFLFSIVLVVNLLVTNKICNMLKFSNIIATLIGNSAVCLVVPNIIFGLYFWIKGETIPCFKLAKIFCLRRKR